MHRYSDSRWLIIKNANLTFRLLSNDCDCDYLVSLKGQFTQKWKFWHHLLTLKLFSTCTSFFLLLNTKEVILKNGNQTVAGRSQWLLATVGYPNSYKFGTTWVSKWWQNFPFLGWTITLMAFCDHFLTLVLFQTCMSFFILWNTKYILKNV